MKKLMTLALVGLALGVVFASCKSSAGHCDAYGNKSGQVEINKADKPA